MACACARFGAVSGLAAPYADPVTYDNWVYQNVSCLDAIFVDYNNGDLHIRPDAPFLTNITFTEIPWDRIGTDGAYETIPPYLPGLSTYFICLFILLMLLLAIMVFYVLVVYLFVYLFIFVCFYVVYVLFVLFIMFFVCFMLCMFGWFVY